MSLKEPERPNLSCLRHAEQNSVVSNERTQSHCWLYDELHPEVFPAVSRRMDRATGLLVSRQSPFSTNRSNVYIVYESEPYQVGL